MKRVIFAFAFVFLCLALILGLVIAQSNGSDNNSTSNQTSGGNNNATNSSGNNATNGSDNNQSGGSNQTGNWSKVCQGTNNRVAGRMKMYEDNRDPHLNRFKNIVRTLEKVINISESKGYDTLDLEADLETLNAMIKKFQDDYALFVQKLKDTRNYTCGHSEGRFKQALKEAKDQLKVVRQDIENIKVIVKTIEIPISFKILTFIL